MTALYFAALRPEDRVAVKPHASPIFHAIPYLFGNQTRENLENFRGYKEAQSAPIEELVLVDQIPFEAVPDTVPVRHIVGDLRDASVRGEIFRMPLEGVFHLASALTAEAERDFDGGMSFNVLGFIDFLNACRQHGRLKFVFSSSNAAFGGRLPDIVPDEIQQRPQTSYGVQKVIAELLIDDYTRRDYLDGRGLRLPTVLLRPPERLTTLSSHISAVACKPLAGEPVVCHFDADMRIPAASSGAVARALIQLYEMPGNALGPVRTINLSALTVTIGEMIEAVLRHLGPEKANLISWDIDPEMTRTLKSMASGLTSERGLAAGIVADPDFDAIIDDYLAVEWA